VSDAIPYTRDLSGFIGLLRGGLLLGLFFVVGQVDATHARLDVARDELLQAFLHPQMVADDGQQARLVRCDVGPRGSGVVIVAMHEAERRPETRADLARAAGVVPLAGLERQALKVREELYLGKRHLFWEMP